ncbi:hypothetical protein TNCV_833891 [Trichonephila clavipes]|nr:hypothetical protein TNCV_833891 [Trichonephila clavipes]
MIENWVASIESLRNTGLRTERQTHLSPRTIKANQSLPNIASFFYLPSVYSWHALDTVDLENPSCLTISEIQWPICLAHLRFVRDRRRLIQAVYPYWQFQQLIQNNHSTGCICSYHSTLTCA